MILGILGSGQLARMLAQAAQAVGLRTLVLAEHVDDPAVAMATEFLSGKTTDPGAVRTLVERSDRVVFENEWLDPEILAAAGGAKKFFPPVPVILKLRDKLEQKRFFAKALPSAVTEAREIDASTPVDAQLAALPWPYVLKWALYGYDGKGTWLGDGGESAAGFCARAFVRGSRVYAEPRVSFKRELAIVACATDSGVTTLPLVVSEQERGICRWVYGPAKDWGVSEDAERQAQRAAQELCKGGLRGTFAIEFFEGMAGGLVINEVAPRVHNTGHYSIEVFRGGSQFDRHVAAAAGKPSPALLEASPFVMLNILGREDRHFYAAPEVPAPAGTFVHWYGKNESRVGRKLGHLTRKLAHSGDLATARVDLLALESAMLKA